MCSRLSLRQTFQAPIKRCNPPILDLIGIAAEHRLIELDDSNTQSIQFLSFFVKRLSCSHCHRRLVTVVLVGSGIDDGHRTRQCHLYRLIRLGQHELGISAQYGFCPLDWTNAAADFCKPAVISRPFLGQLLIVEPIQTRRHIGEIRCASLFAITDNINTGLDLIMNGNTRCVIHRRFEHIAREMPVCSLAMHLLALGIQGKLLHEPTWFWHRSHNGGFKWVAHSSVSFSGVGKQFAALHNNKNQSGTSTMRPRTLPDCKSSIAWLMSLRGRLSIGI